MEKLDFDRRCECDWCSQTELCSITHYGTTEYTRLICLECALSINQNQRIFNVTPFDLNNSNIRFKDLVFDVTKEDDEEEL